MLLKASFDAFLSDRVNLNPSRRDAIIRAHNAVRDGLYADPNVKAYYITCYLQGSYALGTAIKPQAADEAYDADVVICLRMEDAYGRPWDGHATLAWLAERIDAIPTYTGKVEVLARCVRIAYSSDGARFHVDVLPSRLVNGSEGPIYIPTDWCVSNPRGFITWFRQQNTARSGHLKEVVRLLKFWRNRHCAGFGPNSMVLTALAARSLPVTALSLDDALVRTMRGIYGWLSGVAPFATPCVENPSLAGENLARNWPYLSVSLFKDKLGQALATAEAALASDDEEETIALWNSRELFDGAFPKTVRGLGVSQRATAAAMAAGTLRVDAVGQVGVGQGVIVRDNRGFYGR